MSVQLIAPLQARLLATPHTESRKRRLDHLTWEEKLQRKKLKNRVAAQTSRDRKKAKMDEMEDRMHLLEKSNSKLLDEMRSLKELNERLLTENGQLKKKLASANAVVSAEPCGSAESRPLLQERSAPTAARAEPALALYQLAMVFLLSKISLHKSSQANTLAALKSLPTAYSEKLMRKVLTQMQTNPKLGLKVKEVHEKWWGPQQSTWNPVELKA